MERTNTGGLPQAHPPIQILLVGAEGGGKTSLVNRLTKDIFDEKISSTTRLNQVDFELHDIQALKLTAEELREFSQTSITLSIRDLGGGITVTNQDKVENLKEVRDDAVMLVFDGTKSFPRRTKAKEPIELAKWRYEHIEKHAPQASVLVVANKVAGELEQNQVVQRQDSYSLNDGQEFVNGWNESRRADLLEDARRNSVPPRDTEAPGVQFMQISAKTSYNVVQAFNQLAAAVLKKRLAPLVQARQEEERMHEDSNFAPYVDTSHKRDEVVPEAKPNKLDDKDKGCCACAVM